jgi:hypothetical protein
MWLISAKFASAKGGEIGPCDFALASRRSDTDHHPNRAALSLSEDSMSRRVQLNLWTLPANVELKT